jgi:PAS domain S-box-containing protein
MKKSNITIFLIAIIFISTCFRIFAEESNDSVATIKTETDLLLVGKQIYFLEDNEGRLTIGDIVKQENQQRFRLNNEDIFIRKPTPSVYWLKLNLENQTSKEAWLEMGSTFLWYIDYFTESSGNYILTTETGSLRPENKKAYPSNLFWLPVGNKKERQTVYIRIKTQRPMEAPMQFGSTFALTQNKVKTDILFGCFVGILSIIFFYNLFLFLATKDRFYIWYLLYLPSIAITTTSVNHYSIFSYLPNEFLKEWLKTHAFVWATTSNLMVGLFANSFLHLSVVSPNLKKILNVFLFFFAFAVPILDISLIIPHYLLVRIYQPMSFLYVIFLLFTGIYLWKQKIEKNAIFYVLGWTGFLSAVIVYFLTVNGYLPYTYITRNILYLGVVLETLMFAFANRINNMRSEKDLMQSALLLVTQEQKEILELSIQQRLIDINRISTALENTNSLARVGSWELNLNTGEVTWSKVSKEIMEISPDFKLTRSEVIQFFKEGENRERISKAVANAIENGTPYNLEMQMVTAKGRELWVRVIGNAEFRDGKCARLYGAFQDIDQLKRSENENQEIRNQLEAALESTADGILIVDSKENIIRYNKKILKLFQYSNEELNSVNEKVTMEIVLSKIKGAGEFSERITDIYSKPSVSSFDLIELQDDRVYECYSKPMQRNLTILGRVWSFRDITQRKLAQELLKSKENFLLTLTDSLPGMVGYWTKDLICSYANKNYLDWFGKTNSQMIGIHIKELLGDKVYTLNLPYIEQALKGVSINFERTLTKPDGRVGYTWAHYIPDSDSGGNVTGFFVLVSDVTDLKITQLQLEDAKRKSETANRAKSAFLANMSHELRTPLNGIIGFTDLLLKTNLNETQNLYMNTVSQSANSLLSLINDILDFSKIEAGKLELNIYRIDLHELVNLSVGIVRFSKQDKPVNILINIAPNMHRFIWVDGLRIRQVLINLLGNAIKFTKQGEIEIKIEILESKEVQPGHYESLFQFSVRDTGIGISKENQTKIFEAFSQEDASITRKYGGTGLGLTISNQLLLLMGSRMELESEVGKGSRFYFSLKVKSELENSNEIANTVLLEEIENNLSDLQKNNIALRILLVEDNPVNMLLAKILIAEIAPQSIIIEADNGKHAVEEFKKKQPDIIFMDIQMPEMNGYEATIEIRKMETNKRTPIIALTAGILKGEQEKCKEVGMDDYIPKPIAKGSIQKVISNWLLRNDIKDEELNRKSNMDHFSLEQLKERIGDNKELIDKLLLMARGNFDEYLLKQNQNLQEKNLTEIKNAAHKLKGTALSLCFNSLSELAARLEKKENFNAEEISNLMIEIEKEIEYLIKNVL